MLTAFLRRSSQEIATQRINWPAWLDINGHIKDRKSEVLEMKKIALLLAFVALAVLLASTAAVLTAEPSAGQTSAVTLVGAGDISRCDSKGDTATAKLLDSISGPCGFAPSRDLKHSSIPILSAGT